MPEGRVITAPVRVATSRQMFRGPHDGECANCNRAWGGHAGIACVALDYSLVGYRCPRCDRPLENHSRHSCEIPVEELTYPVEFVELWAEIGKAHAACVCNEEYTPKTWPKSVLKKAKEAGLSRRNQDRGRDPNQIRGLSYSGVFSDEMAFHSPREQRHQVSPDLCRHAWRHQVLLDGCECRACGLSYTGEQLRVAGVTVPPRTGLLPAREPVHWEPSVFTPQPAPWMQASASAVPTAYTPIAWRAALDDDNPL